jgi:hypothetical protein
MRADCFDLSHDERATAEAEGDDDDDRGGAHDESRQRQPCLQRMRAEALHRGRENLASDHDVCAVTG